MNKRRPKSEGWFFLFYVEKAFLKIFASNFMGMNLGHLCLKNKNCQVEFPPISHFFPVFFPGQLGTWTKSQITDKIILKKCLIGKKLKFPLLMGNFWKKRKKVNFLHICISSTLWAILLNQTSKVENGHTNDIPKRKSRELSLFPIISGDFVFWREKIFSKLL